MKEPTTKQLQRMEKKKKKMAALLEITKLNDKDREPKMSAFKTADSQDSNSGASDIYTTKRKHSYNGAFENTYQKDKTLPLEISREDSAVLNNKKPRLNDKEFAKLKEELRERKKRLKVIPRIRLNTAGESASLTINVKNENRIPIFLGDIQHLLLYSLLGCCSPYLPLGWCHLEKQNKVTHTVMFVIEGLSLYHFTAYETMFPHITNNLEHRLEVITAATYGGSIIEELSAVPFTGTQVDKFVKQYGTLDAAFQISGDVTDLLKTLFPVCTNKWNASENSKVSSVETDLPSTDNFPRTHLLLSLSQMVEENYPVPLNGSLATKYHNYIFTKDSYAEITPKSPMFALDCEMCKTTSDELELTRISLVDESMNIIYESLVKPKNKITDYLTRYSGITEEMLSNVTTTLEEVQQQIKAILPADAILIGQSLNSDLHALKMMHPYIIDTSVIFNITGDRYRKTKLQTLAREFLGERIQESKNGHCSTEDSKASMRLVQLKLANSIDYGDAVLLGYLEMRTLNLSTEYRKRALRRSKQLKMMKYATSIFNHVTKDKKTSAVVGNREIVDEYSRYIKCTSNSITNDLSCSEDCQVRLVTTEKNKHSVVRASEIAMEHAFTLCHVKITEDQLQSECIKETFSTVNTWISRLWQHTALNGLFCVLFGGRKTSANGACFLNIKKEINKEIQG